MPCPPDGASPEAIGKPEVIRCFIVGPRSWKFAFFLGIRIGEDPVQLARQLPGMGQPQGQRCGLFRHRVGSPKGVFSS